MWCPQCQADVATEVSADGKRLLCTICGEEVRKAFAGSQHPETQSARELLDRWSKSDFLESYGAVAAQAEPEEISAAPAETPAPLTATPAPVITPPAVTPPLPVAASEPPVAEEEDTGVDLLPSPRPRDAQAERPVRKIHRGARPPVQRPASPKETPPVPSKAPVLNWRVDAAHEVIPAKQPPAIPAPRTDFREQFDRAQETITATATERRDDQPHLAAPAPHFDLSHFATGKKPGRQESFFGQLLAYLGVGLLTVGTALVVWGHFGGPDVQKYQSTGWLISTAGQMLLFLGVVTLVSGGMQQTTHEVAQRVEYLGGRMLRIEQSTQELLRGPYFAKSSADQKARTPGDDTTAA